MVRIQITSLKAGGPLAHPSLPPNPRLVRLRRKERIRPLAKVAMKKVLKVLREGAVNPDAPACNTQFENKKW